MRKVTGEMWNISVPIATAGTEMSYEKAHDLFAHARKDMTMKIAKYLDFNASIKDKDPCEDCVIEKVKQSDIPKKSKYQKSRTIGKRRYLNISYIKQGKEIKINFKRYWAVLTEECAGYNDTQ